MPRPEPIWISMRAAKPPSRRTLDAEVWARLPAVFQASAWLTFRLPRRSRLRKALLRRGVLQQMGAWARGDFEFALTRIAPDVLATVEIRSGVTLAFEPSYRGRDEYRELLRTYQEAFGDYSFQPMWLIDLGEDVLVMLLQHTARGRASGVEVEQVSAHRLQMRSGLVVREEMYAAPGHDFAPLVRAVGLDAKHLPRMLGASSSASSR